MGVFCKYCGREAANVRVLTSCLCPRHPDGANKGKHVLYEGSEKSQYTCKYCGRTAASIRVLTSCVCPRHPAGANKGKHEPAL